MSSSDGGAEPQAKIPKKEATYEEFSDLLSQPREILLQIVNNLDPKSFLKLASTCKYLLNFCQNSKGIHVTFDVSLLNVEDDRNGNILYNYFLPPHVDRMTSRKYMGQLRKWPFSICIDTVKSFALGPNFTWDRLFEEMKAQFLTIGLKKIRHFEPFAPVFQTAHDVEYIAKFVKAFDIDSFDPREVTPREAFEGCLKLPVSKLRIWRHSDSDFGIDSVIQCSIPTLLYYMRLNMDHFEKIMQMWLTKNGLESWWFHYDYASFNIMRYFDDWEILCFASVGPIGSKRRLVFMDVINDEYYDMKSFYLLRNDGKVLRIVFKPSHVEFDICPSDEAPPALRSLYF